MRLACRGALPAHRSSRRDGRISWLTRAALLTPVLISALGIAFIAGGACDQTNRPGSGDLAKVAASGHSGRLPGGEPSVLPGEHEPDSEPAGSWCAAGWWQLEPDGSWTCLSTDAPEPTTAATATREPLVGDCCFTATRYGDGRQRRDGTFEPNYNGGTLGCPGVTLPAGRPDRLYHSADPAILAAPPERYRSWECGQGLRIVNPRNGRELEVIRMDSCPGCGPMHVDLSEAGMAWLCGVEYPETCDRLDGLIVVEAW